MKKKLNIGIVTGGNVAERGISLKSGKTIFDHLDKEKYNAYLIDFDGENFIEIGSGVKIRKKDFSFKIKNKRKKINLAFLMLHGHPAEDGVLQGYLDIIGIPYTGCDHFVSGLTFDKQSCKVFLKHYNIPMAASMLIRRGDDIDFEAIAEMGFPLFVKPNKNGSSYGISKVNNHSDIQTSIEKSFQFDDEVIIESFLKGREFSNGVFRKGKEIIVLPITEIISENDFFDYEAKYENASDEVTPADLTEEETAACKALSRKLYEVLNCKGMVRFDTIKMNGIFYFLEANTIPGFSEQSLFPQQIRAEGMTIQAVLDDVVDERLG